MVEDLANKTTVFGDTIARFGARGYSIVPRNPLLMSIDSSMKRDSLTGLITFVHDTMFVRSRVMEAYQGDSGRFIATDSVRMVRTNFSGSGGKLVYDQKRDIMTFSESNRQRLWYDSTEIDADSIAVVMVDKHVSRVFAVGHAFTTSPVSEFPSSNRINQLEGERMMLVVQNDTVRYLLDMNNALSIYFLVREGKPDGVNRASGDTIRIDFKDRTVSRLVIRSGTEGEYFPERFVARREQAFRLSNYERNPMLRPRRAEFVPRWDLPVKEKQPATAPAPSKATPETPETNPVTPTKKKRIS
jgi:hypothetical protein